MKSIHIANTTTGKYDVKLPLPYPYHINAEGGVERQDFWKGEPAALIGFQRDVDVQHVDVHAADWLKDDSIDVVGMFPVFVDADGGFWNSARPVTSVS